jgi:hypothetical protein
MEETGLEVANEEEDMVPLGNYRVQVCGWLDFFELMLMKMHSLFLHNLSWFHLAVCWLHMG